MQQTIDLGTVVANTASHMGWSGFTLFCGLVIAIGVWALVPFVLWSIRQRLEGVEMALHDQRETLGRDLKRTNDLLMVRITQEAPKAAAAPQPHAEVQHHAEPAEPHDASKPPAGISMWNG